jgi:Saxitoxin biosynthesis operon protein SxtJ
MSIKSSNLPSNRTFGLLFIGVFALLGFYSLWKGWVVNATQVFFALSALLAAITLFAPVFLTPLNKAWYQLGLLLGKVVSPIVLGILFFIVITPVAICMRLAGRDALKLRKQDVSSHWIDRKPPGPEPESFKEQF